MTWIIEIDGEFWVKFKTAPMGRWTKNRLLATPVTSEEARVYMKDWARWGVKKHPCDKTWRASCR